MKRILSVLLALCVLLFALSGCAKRADAPKKNEPAAQSASSQAQAPGTAKEDDEDDKPSASKDWTAGMPATPATGYGKYVEVKGKSFERINEKIDENSEIALTVGFALLPVAMIDLTLIPLTVVGIEGGAAALSMLSLQDIDIKQNGSAYTVTYKDGEGNTCELVCEYDAKADSMKTVLKQNGNEVVFFEYVNTGSAYASQYYTIDEDDGGALLITCFFDEENITAVGITSVDGKPASIVNNKGLTTDFVKNDELYLIIENGQLTVMNEGELKTY